MRGVKRNEKGAKNIVERVARWPSFLQTALSWWNSAATDAEKRERLVNEFVKKSSPDLRFFASRCIYKGPRDNRTLTPVAYAEFVTADDACNCANKHKDAEVDLGLHMTASTPSSKGRTTLAAPSRTVFPTSPLGEGRGTAIPQVLGNPVA